MVAVKIDLPPEFVDKCEADGVTPKQVLEGFIRDLCDLPGSGGSDERDRAWDYYERRGYTYLAAWAAGR